MSIAIPHRRNLGAPSIVTGLFVSAMAGAAVGLGFGILAAGVLVIILATAVGLIRWQWSLYGLLVYLPISGIPIIATYPETAAAVLAKDFLFVIPAYAGFFLHFAVYKRRLSMGGVPVFLIGCLVALAFGHAFNPALPNRLVAAIGLKVWLLYIPLYVLGYHLVRTRESLDRFLRVMALASVIPVLVGLTEAVALSLGHQHTIYRFYGDAASAVTQNFAELSIEGGTLRRVPSTFSFVSQYFAFLVGMTSVTYAWWRGSPANRGKSLFRGLLWVLVVAAGVLSGARAAFVFIPFLIALILLLERAKRTVIPVGRIGAIVGILLASVGLVGSTARGLFADVLRLGAEEFQSIFVDGLRRAAGITLVGLGTGIDTNASRYAFERAELFPAVEGVWYESWWVKSFLEFGIPGLVVVVALLGTIVVRGLQRHRSLSDPSLRCVSACLLAFLIWNLVFNMKGQYMDMDPINVYFWLFAGVLARLPELEGDPMVARNLEQEEDALFVETREKARAAPVV